MPIGTLPIEPSSHPLIFGHWAKDLLRSGCTGIKFDSQNFIWANQSAVGAIELTMPSVLYFSECHSDLYNRYSLENQWLRPCGGEPYPVMESTVDPCLKTRLKTTLIRRPPCYKTKRPLSLVQPIQSLLHERWF